MYQFHPQVVTRKLFPSFINNLPNKQILTSITFVGLSHATQFRPFSNPQKKKSPLRHYDQKCSLVQPKFTFRRFSIHFLITHSLQYHSQILFMIIFVTLMHQNIKYYSKLIQTKSKYPIYQVRNMTDALVNPKGMTKIHINHSGF